MKRLGTSILFVGLVGLGIGAGSQSVGAAGAISACWFDGMAFQVLSVPVGGSATAVLAIQGGGDEAYIENYIDNEIPNPSGIVQTVAAGSQTFAWEAGLAGKVRSINYYDIDGVTPLCYLRVSYLSEDSGPPTPGAGGIDVDLDHYFRRAAGESALPNTL